MKWIVIWAVRLVLFVACTFSFVVLFDHGPSGFAAGFESEMTRVVHGLRERVENIRQPASDPALRGNDFQIDSESATP